MADIVKRQFILCFQVEKEDKIWNMKLRTQNLEEVHRVLVESTSRRKPVAEWFDLVVHEECADGTTNEYGKVWLGGMYDHKYTYSSAKPQPVVKTSLYTTGLSLPKKTGAFSLKDSLFDAPFLTY